MYEIYLLIILQSPVILIGQRLYFSGNLSAYSYKYRYEGDYPFKRTTYTDYSPSTNSQLGIGYSFNDQHSVEFGVSKIGIRYHYIVPIFAIPNCIYCIVGPGFEYIAEDYKSVTNFNFSYKYGVFMPRHYDQQRSFQLFGLLGVTIQNNPPRADVLFKPLEPPIPGEAHYTHDRTDQTKVVIRLGIEFEKRLKNNFYFWGGFTQYIGFSPQMTTYINYQEKGGVPHEGLRYTTGSGRNISVGFRYYVPLKKILSKGLDSTSVKKGYLYAGFDFGRFHNKQINHSDNIFTYPDQVPQKFQKEDRRFQGAFLGYRKNKNFYEFGFYVMPDNIGYTFEERYFSSTNYTSMSYMYMPLRYKYSVVSVNSTRQAIELITSIGLSVSHYLPYTFRSDVIRSGPNPPTETFKHNSFLVGTEVGAELAWNIGRITIAGYGRYMFSFRQSRQVDFETVIDNKQISGYITSKSSGSWNGISVRYLFNR